MLSAQAFDGWYNCLPMHKKSNCHSLKVFLPLQHLFVHILTHYICVLTFYKALYRRQRANILQAPSMRHLVLLPLSIDISSCTVISKPTACMTSNDGTDRRMDGHFEMNGAVFLRTSYVHNGTKAKMGLCTKSNC